MALGTITVVEQSNAQGPVFYDRVTIVGDSTTPAGGTPDFEASFQAASLGPNAKTLPIGRTILAVIPEYDAESNQVEYNHTDDKLRVVSKAAHAEQTGNLSGETYSALIISH